MKTIVITSGYFNPIHPWHIECLQLCKELWDELRVIVNSDKQVRDKTGKQEVFQDENFRIKVVSSIKPVNEVILSVDQDWSVCQSIKHTANLIKEKYGPEVQVCKELNIEIKDGLWAKTHNSSEYRAKS